MALPRHPWLTLGQAAAHLGVSRNLLRSWADAGYVPVRLTAGGHRRFHRADLDAFLTGTTAQETRLFVLICDPDERWRRLVRVNLLYESEAVDIDEVSSIDLALLAVRLDPPSLLVLGPHVTIDDNRRLRRELRDGGPQPRIPIATCPAVDIDGIAAELRRLSTRV